MKFLKGKLCALLIFSLLCGRTFAQTSYYQAVIYFSSGVTRHITATDTSAVVTASDVQTVLTRYAVGSTYVYPAYPRFNESDTLQIITTDSGPDSIKTLDRAKVFTVTLTDTTVRRHLINDMIALPEVVFAEVNGDYVTAAVPNDVGFSQQWGLNNTVHPGIDIHAEAAWDITTGNTNSIIAIIDQGVDISHSDLSAKIVGGDNTFHVEPGGSHGTQVAGIAAASTNNTTGMAGVDWKAKLLPEDIYDYYTAFPALLGHQHGDVLIDQKITNAIHFSPYVWTINNSYTELPHTLFSFILRASFADAYKNNRTMVVAAGNDGQIETLNYPSGFNTGLICVGQTDNVDNLGPTSGGTFLDVVAPGQLIYTTDHNNTYVNAVGTSMAAPFVSGVASLLKGYNTSLVNDDIENLLKLGAKDLGATGWDNNFGYGRINAQNSLLFLQAPYSLQHLTATGGTVFNTSGTTKFIMLGIPRLADGQYLGNRIEVRKTINLPLGYCSLTGVWGDGFYTTGYRDDGANCFGDGFCEIVPGSQTATQVTLRTYVYQLTTILGQQLGYFPRAPQNVTFGYSTLGLLQPTISGDNIFCSTSNTYSLSNLPAGATVAWTATPAGIVQINSPTALTTTLTRLSNGVVTLHAAISNACGGSANITKQVTAGAPTISSSTYNNNGTITNLIPSPHPPLTYNPACDDRQITTIMNLPGATFATWTLGTTNSSFLSWAQTGNNLTFHFIDAVPKTATFNLAASNTCGTASASYAFQTQNCSGGNPLLIISPNPANGSAQVATVDNSNITAIKISDKSGNLKKQYTFAGNSPKVNIDVSNLGADAYIIQVYNGKTWMTELLKKQ